MRHFIGGGGGGGFRRRLSEERRIGQAGEQADWFEQIPASMAYAARGVDWSAPHPAINKPTEREQFRDEPHYSVPLCFTLFLLPSPSFPSLSPFLPFSLFLPLIFSFSFSPLPSFVSPRRSSHLTRAINDSARARCVIGAFEKRPVTCPRDYRETDGRKPKASRTFSFHALISFLPRLFLPLSLLFFPCPAF